MTAYDYSKAIRMALRKAVNDNILIKNPAAGVKGLQEPETDHIFLNIDEVQKLADTRKTRRRNKTGLYFCLLYRLENIRYKKPEMGRY
jgi:hypothetical protein